MEHEKARMVLHELNRKLLLLRSEESTAIRQDIIDSILEEKQDVSFEEQCIEKQLKILLDLAE